MPFRYTLKQLKQVRQWFKDHPGGTVKVHMWPEIVMNKNQWLKWFMDCLNEKINRYEKIRGRRDCQEYFIEMIRAAREINHPRLIIDYLPRDLKIKFKNRLRENIL